MYRMFNKENPRCASLTLYKKVMREQNLKICKASNGNYELVVCPPPTSKPKEWENTCFQDNVSDVTPDSQELHHVHSIEESAGVVDDIPDDPDLHHVHEAAGAENSPGNTANNPDTVQYIQEADCDSADDMASYPDLLHIQNECDEDAADETPDDPESYPDHEAVDFDDLAGDKPDNPEVHHIKVEVVDKSFNDSPDDPVLCNVKETDGFDKSTDDKECPHVGKLVGKSTFTSECLPKAHQVFTKKRSSKNFLVKMYRNRGESYTSEKSGKFNLGRRYLQKPRCDHSSFKHNHFACGQISDQARTSMKEDFYDMGQLSLQRAFIARHVSYSSHHRKKNKILCTLPDPENPGHTLPVCSTMFMNTLAISSRQIRTVLKKKLPGGGLDKERRGGVRKKFPEKRKAILDHLRRFQQAKSHHCPGNTNWPFLSGKLTADRMYRMFNKENPRCASLTLYKKVMREQNLKICKASNGNYELVVCPPPTSKPKEWENTCFQDNVSNVTPDSQELHHVHSIEESAGDTANNPELRHIQEVVDVYYSVDDILDDPDLHHVHEAAGAENSPGNTANNPDTVQYIQEAVCDSADDMASYPDLLHIQNECDEDAADETPDNTDLHHVHEGAGAENLAWQHSIQSRGTPHPGSSV